MKSTKRIVRRGCIRAMSRAASSTIATPVPSSWAPTARSQESRCAPSSTTSAGFSRPRISATTLAESTSGSVRQPSCRRTRTGPAWSQRWITAASSVASATAGIARSPALNTATPVCGVRNEAVAAERTIVATAPRAAAFAGPKLRSSDASAYPSAEDIEWWK